MSPSPPADDTDDRLCAGCGHSYTQHTKGASPEKYCRHCPCPEWIEPAPPEQAQPITLECNCGEVATEHCNVHGDHLAEQALASEPGARNDFDNKAAHQYAIRQITQRTESEHGGGALWEALDQTEIDLRFLSKILSKYEDQEIKDIAGVAASFADRAKRALAAQPKGAQIVTPKPKLSPFEIANLCTSFVDWFNPHAKSSVTERIQRAIENERAIIPEPKGAQANEDVATLCPTCHGNGYTITWDNVHGDLPEPKGAQAQISDAAPIGDSDPNRTAVGRPASEPKGPDAPAEGKGK